MLTQTLRPQSRRDVHRTLDRRTSHIRANWTPEERAWRAMLAIDKLVKLLPRLIEPRG